MKYAVLIRHGESYTNRNGILSTELNKYRLTEEGIEQARFTGEQLKGLKFDGIVSSPVLRAVETAHIINQYLNLDIVTDNRAIESDFGEYNGKRIVDIPDKSRNELGMESFQSQADRMISLINSYDGNYIVVSHSFPIRCVLAHYLGMDEEESFGIDIRHASMSTIDLTSQKLLAIGSLLVSQRIKKILQIIEA
ncbi:2,3-diphosphoglycerate-dependent phosphoglycerate mutase [Ferroplasma sp.]|uniref:2,3-diphosphoglycerate-dependent phosphoglycerate mutase n=1 Tax=Ferroplasma sp. TaxID=2591003 RepID=UPI00307DE579